MYFNIARREAPGEIMHLRLAVDLHLNGSIGRNVTFMKGAGSNVHSVLSHAGRLFLVLYSDLKGVTTSPEL